jgi:heme-degrading monooxygenase HmoA
MSATLLRIWRGRIRWSDVEEYERYQLATAYPRMTATDGNCGLYLVRRDDGDAAEFATFSLWTSWDAVRGFAGDDPYGVVDLPADERFLVGNWRTVANYDVFKSVPAVADSARIIRVWRGATRRSDGDAYEDYLEKTGFAEYSATEGNRGVYMTRRDVADRAEFCCVSLWESWDGVRAFAGDEPERAVFYPEDDRFLVDRELTVAHYAVFAST